MLGHVTICLHLCKAFIQYFARSTRLEWDFNSKITKVVGCKTVRSISRHVWVEQDRSYKILIKVADQHLITLTLNSNKSEQLVTPEACTPDLSITSIRLQFEETHRVRKRIGFHAIGFPSVSHSSRKIDCCVGCVDYRRIDVLLARWLFYTCDW